jgi:ATP-dependent Lon protease
LEREIAKICRKVVKENVVSSQGSDGKISLESLEVYSGVRKYDYGKAEEQNVVGQVNGLAWTSVGGELLTIESSAVEGKGKTIKTGSLGDVMQESIQAAFTVVRSRAKSLGLDANFHEKFDLHIHVPEGATPKDGPSAGIGMCTALVSVLTGIPVKSDVAMTGEITLRGQVLKIGGLKEKLLAAHRGNIKAVLIPADNERDLADIPENIKSDLQIVPVRWIDEVLEHALQYLPSPTAVGVESIPETESSGEETDQGGEEKLINTH